MSVTAGQLITQLASTKCLHARIEWATAFLDSQRASTPRAAVVQSANYRLLASDITTSLRTEPAFPIGIQRTNVHELTLAGPIVVQVLDVEDISKSRWDQVDAIGSIERGEGTRRREIIRVTATEDEDGQARNPSSVGSTHKLVLQDAAGTIACGLEVVAIPGVSTGMDIGSKLLLQEALVARGTILLEPSNARLLGGKIESLHVQWNAGRKARLEALIAGQREDE